MNYFKIFSNCIAVKGYTQSLIADLQRQISETIPNDLYDIIELLNSKRSIEEICEEYGVENTGIISEYLDFLKTKEFGFYCNKEEFDLFPTLNMEFDNPSQISNIIIEIKSQDINILNNIIKQLFELQCENLVLIFYEKLTKNHIIEIGKVLNGYPVRSLEVVCKYDDDYNQQYLEYLSMIMQLTKITFFKADCERIDYWDDKIFFDRIYTEKEITSFKFCGVVDIKYFNTNLQKVLEATNHNSCLHKKIAIDKDGNIKNCPSMIENFGNINDTTLRQALNRAGFKKYWNLTKDSIEVCKDCEFRYICTDCRAYTERSNVNSEGLDISKPLKCGYNPYIGEWEEWSTNPLKQKAIKHYGIKNIIKANKS